MTQCESLNGCMQAKEGSDINTILTFLVTDVFAIYNPRTSPNQVTDHQQGTILSHKSYSYNDYPTDINSSLAISGLRSQQILHIRFLTFKLYYYYPGCLYDFMEITGIAEENEKRFCSDPSHKPFIKAWYNYTISKSTLVFRFITNSYHGTDSTGFNIEYFSE